MPTKKVDLSSQFLSHSIELTKSLDKKTKKDGGIFFTPKISRDRLLNRTVYWLDRLDIKPRLIVEPSCGSCEFIHDLDSIYKNKQIIGVETNTTIYNKMCEIQSTLVVNNTLNLYNSDFIEYDINCVELFIGNPPFLVMKAADITPAYQDYMTGRPNLFGLFIVKCLKSLNENGGVVSFVLPKSILNSVYYEKIRRLIFENFTLLEIIDLTEDSKYIDTDQTTVGLIITNKENKLSIPKYSLLINDSVVFAVNYERLVEILAGSTTLKSLGLSVKTGPIVWNEHKDILTNNSKKTLLIYNSNIVDGVLKELEFKNDEKKQYIDISATRHEHPPFIVVNRGQGNSHYTLNYAIITRGNVVVENHLNIIYNVSNDDPLILSKILKSLADDRTSEFLELYCGNNSLSKTELESILPIYL
jgi:adenine-specific DNA-methyltransferase